MKWLKKNSDDYTVQGTLVELVSYTRPWMFVPEQLIKRHGKETAYFMTLLDFHESEARMSEAPDEEKLELLDPRDWKKTKTGRPTYVWVPWKLMAEELSLHIDIERIPHLFAHLEAMEMIKIHPKSDTQAGDYYVKFVEV